jgi:hypothetical protein
MIWSFLLSLLGLTVLSGAVLGAALGLSGFAILHFFGGGATRLGVQAVFNVLGEFTLTAIPLFILLGDVLVASGLAGGIYRALSPLFARLHGGLLHTNIAVCTVFGAVSGSSMSVSAAVGSVAYPQLAQRGYDRKMVVGTLAAGGTLGLLIPPSLDRHLDRQAVSGGRDTGPDDGPVVHDLHRVDHAAPAPAGAARADIALGTNPAPSHGGLAYRGAYSGRARQLVCRSGHTHRIGGCWGGGGGDLGLYPRRLDLAQARAYFH